MTVTDPPNQLMFCDDHEDDELTVMSLMWLVFEIVDSMWIRIESSASLTEHHRVVV